MPFFWLLLSPILGLVALLLWPPKAALSYLSTKTGVLFRLDTTEKIAYLTIDDGPSEFTPQILQTLRDLGIKATFFLIGDRINKFQETTQLIYSHGHAIANHDSSNRRSVAVPIAELTRSLVNVNRLLEDRARIRSYYFRPGCGYFSSAMIEAVSRLGMAVTLGDVYPHDPFMPALWMKLVLRHRIQPGSIIILHDGTKNRADKVCDTLCSVIPDLKTQGYRFLPLPCNQPKAR